MALKKSVTRAVIEALGQAMTDLGGYQLTRLRAPALIGDTTLDVESAAWDAADGSAWIGNEPEKITYTGKVLTAGGQQLTGVSGITMDHREGTEVIEANRQYSKLDLLRRALLVDYAEDDDLGRVGRRHAVDRPRGMSDDMYRELIKTIAYLERGPVYALELVLDVLYPSGGWDVYQSLVEFPLKVFIRIPGAIGTNPAGRTFMNARDIKAADTASQVTLSNDPTTVESVRLSDISSELIMSVLPSVDADPWAYQAEVAGIEATYFSVASDILTQTQNGTDGGRYERSTPEIGPDYTRISSAWRADTLTTVNGEPWQLAIMDGEREYALIWSDTDMYLGQVDGTQISAAYALPSPLGTGWYYPTLERKGDTVYGKLNGVVVLSVPASSFAVSASTLASFGFFNIVSTQNWTVDWGWVEFYEKNERNWWNIEREDGVVAAASVQLGSVSNPFVSGDADKLLFLDAVEDENHGLWVVDSYTGAGAVDLDGVERSDGYASGTTPTMLYTKGARFHFQDGVKSVRIDSGLNAGLHVVTGIVSERQVECSASTFVTEDDITWKFEPDFVNESGIPFILVDAGTVSGAVLTLRDAMPSATPDVEAHYTTVKSAQILLDETVSNPTGTEYWPFYITGVNERTQKIIDEITVAGVIPKFDMIYT